MLSTLRLAVLAVGLTAWPCAAVPPFTPFPSAFSPPSTTPPARLPANGRIFAFGGERFDASAVGFAATVNGAAGGVAVVPLGCCAAELTVTGVAGAPLTPGDSIALVVTAPLFDTAAMFVVGAADTASPQVGAVEVVAVQPVSQLDPPVEPAAGAAWLATIDIRGISDDVTVAAVLVRGPDGRLLAASAPSGRPVERVFSGLFDADGGCFVVEVVDTAGNSTQSTQLCADLVIPTPPDDAPAGCSSHGGRGGLAMLVVLLGGLVLLRRKSARAAAALVVSGLTSACTHAPVDACDDGFDDHTTYGDVFSDSYFEEHARAQYGWNAVKFLIVNLEDEATRAFRFVDGDFYELHDEWMQFRLLHGHSACGAPTVVPSRGLPDLPDMPTIRAWAAQQEQLPPYLVWSGDRLLAPDFYRLSRETDPRVYGPGYLTRDLPSDTRAYVFRLAARDPITRAQVEAFVDTLTPLLPTDAALYWKPTPTNPVQTDVGRAMRDSGHPFGPFIVVDSPALM